MRKWTTAVALAGLLAATGCGGTGSVEGTVTYGGRPVTAGTVRFVASDASMHDAPIGTDGRFSISGIPAGTVKIAVINPTADSAGLPGQPPPENPSAHEGVGTSVGRDVAARGEVIRLPPPLPNGVEVVVIPDKYGDPDNSGLERTVSRGANAIDIPLE